MIYFFELKLKKVIIACQIIFTPENSMKAILSVRFILRLSNHCFRTSELEMSYKNNSRSLNEKKKRLVVFLPYFLFNHLGAV